MTSKHLLIALIFAALFSFISCQSRPQKRIALKDWEDHPWCNQPLRGTPKSRAGEIRYHTKYEDPIAGCPIELLDGVLDAKSYPDLLNFIQGFLDPNNQPDFYTHYFDEEGGVLGYHTKILIYPRPDSGLYILGVHQVSKKFPELVDKYYLKALKGLPAVLLVPKDSNEAQDTRFVYFIEEEPTDLIPVNTLIHPKDIYELFQKRNAYWRAKVQKMKEENSKKASTSDL